MINLIAVFLKLQYMDQVDYLTISGNFSATSATVLLYCRCQVNFCAYC